MTTRLGPDFTGESDGRGILTWLLKREKCLKIGERDEKKGPLRIEGLGDGSGEFPRILRGLAPMRSEQDSFLPHCGIVVKLFFSPNQN